jgi:nucleotide-binding universal stress UspA family protein
MDPSPLRHGRTDEMALSPQRPDRPSGADEAHPTTVVVVGVDASERSWDAFWWSCGEAKRLGGRIVAVFVSPATGVGSGMAAAASTMTGCCAVDFYWMDLAATELAEQLRQRLSDTAVHATIDLEFVHAKGSAAAELLRIADAQKADLIVVGKSSKVLHRLAGSLGRRLVGKRHAPVVVVIP